MKKCVMKTDSAFCNSGGGQVRRIMERRRRHGECGGGVGGCEVVVGGSCGGVRGVRGGWRVWEVSLAMWVIGLLVMSLIVNVCFAVKWYFYEMD